MNREYALGIAIGVLAFVLLVTGLLPVALAVGAFVLWVFAILWAAGDAELRGKPPLLVGLLVFLFPVFGFLVWIVFRPDVIVGEVNDQSPTSFTQ